MCGLIQDEHRTLKAGGNSRVDMWQEKKTTAFGRCAWTWERLGLPFLRVCKSSYWESDALNTTQ